MGTLKIILIIGAVVYGLILLAYALKTKRPFRMLAVSALIGVVALIAVNVSSPLTGISLPFNGWTLLTAAAAGIPGIVLMLTMRMVWAI